MKKILTALFLVCLLVSSLFVNFNAYAQDENVSQYTDVTSYKTLVDDAKLNVFTTTNGGTVELLAAGLSLTTFPQVTGFREFKATPAQDWEFVNWTFEQLHNGHDLGNRTSGGGILPIRYSFSASVTDKSTPYDGKSDRICINRLVTHGETRWNPLTYNVYANFRPTITASVDANGTITDPGKVGVDYGTDKNYTITANPGYVISDILVDGVSLNIAPTENYVYTFNKIIAPHTIEAKIRLKMEPIIGVPKINAVDRTIIEGEVFNPLEGVTAEDAEGNNLTNDIVVEENNVNSDEAGTYTVKYKVADKNNIIVRKIINVTVKAAENSNAINKTVVKPNAKKVIKTSDGTNLAMLLAGVVLSAVVLYIVFGRKIKNHNK